MKSKISATFHHLTHSKAVRSLGGELLHVLLFCKVANDFHYSYLLLNSEQTTAVATATFNDSDVLIFVEKLGI